MFCTDCAEKERRGRSVFMTFISVWGEILRRVYCAALVRFFVFTGHNDGRQGWTGLRGFPCLGELGRVLIYACTWGYVVNVMGMVDVTSKVLPASLMPLARRRKYSRVTPALWKTLSTRARERGYVKNKVHTPIPPHTISRWRGNTLSRSSRQYK